MKTNRGKFYEKGLGRNPGDRSEHVLAAPTTTMFLADLGAEVIHLEPPHSDAGDSGLYAGTDRSPESRRRYQRNRLGGRTFSRRMPPHACGFLPPKAERPSAISDL